MGLIPTHRCPKFAHRGLRAVEATSANERLVSVPAKAAITLTASEPTPFKSWVSRDFWERYVSGSVVCRSKVWDRSSCRSSAADLSVPRFQLILLPVRCLRHQCVAHLAQKLNIMPAFVRGGNIFRMGFLQFFAKIVHLIASILLCEANRGT